MMKANKILNLLVFLTMTFAITSCVQDDDFKTPDVSVIDPNINADNVINFSAVVARYNDAVADGDQVGTFEFDLDPLYIEGYVISSDQSGNFFEELIIQNKVDDSDPSEDPRLGFNISINARGLYETYEIGRKVYVKLNGLAVGMANGTFIIGKAAGNSIGQIQEFEYRNIVIRGAEVATITPKVSAIADLSAQYENTLIKIEDAQINRNELGLTYAGEADDEFDGFRTIESCADGGTLLLQTSTFADFKSLPLPQGRGSIQGIFTRDFGDDFNVLVINSREDVNFDTTERCDPIVLECEGPTGNALTVFNQNFESTTTIGQLEALGWTNINVSGGSVKYVIGSFSNNRYAQISGFGSGQANIEAWLVTPVINLDASTGESLTFDFEVAFANGVILQALITDNYTGDVTTTEWIELDVSIPNTPSSGFGGFNNVGNLNISCLDGDVRVAFKYSGSDPSATTRYHIDNFKVVGNN